MSKAEDKTNKLWMCHFDTMRGYTISEVEIERETDGQYYLLPVYENDGIDYNKYPNLKNFRNRLNRNVLRKYDLNVNFSKYGIEVYSRTKKGVLEAVVNDYKDRVEMYESKVDYYKEMRGKFIKDNGLE